MNEFQRDDKYYIPDFNLGDFDGQDGSNLGNPVYDKIEEILSSEKEPVLEGDFAPKTPKKGEIRHWNKRLLDSDPQLKEEPTSNSLLSHRNEALVGSTKKRLLDEQIDPTDDQIAENLPSNATNALKRHIENNGVEELRISGPDIIDAEGHKIGEIDTALVTDGELEETEYRIYREQLEEKLGEAKNILTDSERVVVESLSRTDKTTLNSVSLELGLAREKVRQTHDKAIRKLRHPSSGLLDFVRDSDEPYALSEAERDTLSDEGSFETPVLSDAIAPTPVLQSEQRHWNRLLQNEGLVYEEPAENIVLTHEQQGDIDRAVRKLHKNGIDNPTDKELAEAIPGSKPELKKFIQDHGTTVGDIDEVAKEITTFDDGGLEQAENRISQEQLKAKLSEAKETETSREWAIVEALNGSETPPTPKDLGQTYGISDTRVKHLNRTTLLRLRNQDNGLASFVGDYSGELKEVAVSSFEFPSSEQVPIDDPRDKRPYVERIQDFCEQDTLEWISREKETVEKNPGNLTKLNAGIDNVSQEMDILKGTQRQILMRATNEDPLNNPDLIAVNMRIFKLDAWKYELERRKQKHIDETTKFFRNYPGI